mmetsp:Transcript_26664/g.79546  ORF Transcript_26664/g.79546 Transcript_26664/m.79546 type:complete len:689 (+) Transcript_26664:1954-4020(+)
MGPDANLDGGGLGIAPAADERLVRRQPAVVQPEAAERRAGGGRGRRGEGRGQLVGGRGGGGGNLDERAGLDWRSDVEEDVVPVAAELGHDAAALELHLDRRDARQQAPRVQLVEEVRLVAAVLGRVEQLAARLLALQLGERVRHVPRRAQHEEGSCGERDDISEVHHASVGEALDRAGQHVEQVRRRREVHAHAVADDGVEAASEAVEVGRVARLGAQLCEPGRAERRGRKLGGPRALDMAERLLGEVGGDVLGDVRLRGHLEEDHPLPAPHLNHAARLEGEDLLGRLVDPLGDGRTLVHLAGEGVGVGRPVHGWLLAAVVHLEPVGKVHLVVDGPPRGGGALVGHPLAHRRVVDLAGRAERHRAAQVPLGRNVRRRHLERQRGLDLPAADALARPRDGDADEGTLDELDGDVEQLRHEPEGGGLDFAQLHPHAADLDLPVGAAEVLQPSARVAAAQVAGAVEQSGAVRVEHELLRGELGPVQVAVGDLDAADADLAALAGRERRRWVRGVEYVHGHAGVALEADRVSVRDRVVLGEALVVGDLDRRLGGAVQVDERQRAAERSGQLGAVREEEGLARARDLAEVREVAGRDKVEEEREDRRHKVRDRDGLLEHHAVDGVEVEVRSVGDDGGGAPLQQRDPHLCDRAVEGGRRLMDEDVALREAEQPRAPAKPVPHAGGRDEAALRLA